MGSSASVDGQIYSEPTYNTTRSNTPVANFTIIDTVRTKKYNGDVNERTNYFRITAYGELVSKLQESAEKGAEIVVHGKLSSKMVKDKEGRWITSIELVASDISIVNKKSNKGK